MGDAGAPRGALGGDGFLRQQYDLGHLIGEGASGKVFIARHRVTGDRFAAKVMHRRDASNSRKGDRILARAKAAYRIRHHNVVHLFDIGREHDGSVWQILELLEGQTLTEMLRRYGRFSPLFALDVVLEIAFGLLAAHDLQIIHRDVKPANLFFTFGGVVKVFDFSCARVIPIYVKNTRRAASPATMAYMAYMAPEQLRGVQPTPQFDVYALGLLLWQLLVGHHPYEEVLNERANLINWHRFIDPDPLADLLGLPYVDEVVRGATAKAPRERFAGMWPMIQALMVAKRRLLEDPSVSALLHGRPWELQHPIRSNPWGWSASCPPTAVPASLRREMSEPASMASGAVELADLRPREATRAHEGGLAPAEGSLSGPIRRRSTRR